MKLTIDEFVLEKHGLTIGEFMLLYMAANSINISEAYNNILAKGYAAKADKITFKTTVIPATIKLFKTYFTIGTSFKTSMKF